MSPDHADPEVLYELYWERGMSMDAMARACGVTNGAINHQMVKHGVPRARFPRGMREAELELREEVRAWP